MSDALDLAVDAFAAHRLTRLITADDVTERFRLAVKFQGPEWAGTLIECRWCTGFWVSVAIIAASRVAPKAWRPLARALALSSAAAFLARLETD